MKYKSLSPIQSKLLFAIWGMQSSTPNKVITTTEISKKLHTSEGHVRKIIMDINGLQRGLILKYQYHDETKLMGRPRTAYYLNHNSIVTMPETALILLELSRFRPEKAFRTSRTAFERHVRETHGLSADYVQQRIDEAIRYEYIEVTGDNYIYPSPRMFYEAGYLGLIASEAESGQTETKEPCAKQIRGAGKKRKLEDR